jgi:hypothetical protein
MWRALKSWQIVLAWSGKFTWRPQHVNTRFLSLLILSRLPIPNSTKALVSIGIDFGDLYTESRMHKCFFITAKLAALNPNSIQKHAKIINQKLIVMTNLHGRVHLGFLSGLPTQKVRALSEKQNRNKF